MFRSTLAVRQAGAVPKSSPVTIVSPSANHRTVPSIRTAGIGSVPGGNMWLIVRTAQAAIKNPPRPPVIETTKLSTNNWRSSRLRRAPMAVRTASSVCLAAARASSRFAMLAQAISSTKTTAHRSTSSPGLELGAHERVE